MPRRKCNAFNENELPGRGHPRLIRLMEMALALLEVIRQNYGSHARFLVRKKTFAYFLDNHQGDRIVSITCEVLPSDNKVLVEPHPGRFYFPSYIASKDWVGLRLHLGKIDWNEVR